MNDFLPPDYDGIPKGPSSYMKIQEGQNVFRVLSHAIVGYEYWSEDKNGDRVPVRVRDFEDIPERYLNNDDNRNNAKYFWAFIVYNFDTKNIQLLEIKQKKIMSGIEALIRNKSWGNPHEYNLVITKTKTGSEPRDVEYSVMPEPKEKIDPGILRLYKDMNIDLNALYRGEDPFKSVSDNNIANDAINVGL